MDRDSCWDRVRRAWDAIVDARSELHVPDAVLALEEAYARGETDEFVLPTVIGDGAGVEDGDAVVFMNFRADRARQLTAAFVDPAFAGFEARRPRLSRASSASPNTTPGCRRRSRSRPTTSHDTLGELVSAQGSPTAHRRDREIRARHLLLRRRARGAVPGEERILGCRAQRSRPTTCSRK